VAENGHGMQAGHGPAPDGGRRNVWGTVLAILIVLGLAIGAGYFLTQHTGTATPGSTPSSTQADRPLVSAPTT
jgi:hypothetical protein